MKGPKPATKRQLRRDALIEANLAMVAPLARNVAAGLPREFELEDLIGVGRLALVAAADNYRPKDHGGVPFGVYARYRVRGAMIDSAKDRNYQRVKLTVSADDIDVTAGGDIFDESALDAQRATARLKVGIEKLPERLRIVLDLYYMRGLNFDEIAAVFDVSRQRAGQLHAQALGELRLVLGVDVPLPVAA